MRCGGGGSDKVAVNHLGLPDRDLSRNVTAKKICYFTMEYENVDDRKRMITS